MERLTVKYINTLRTGVPVLSAINKLTDYENKEEQGLLLRLPVSIGSKVWYINGKFILEYEVVGYSVDRTGAWLMYVEHYADETDKTYSYNIDVDKIGKTAFLTKEEAEQKLNEINS